MSRKGNPYDNAFAESFMKTLKHEEVYRSEYRDRNEALAGIADFIERVYNRKTAALRPGLSDSGRV
jgi:putative transposase